MCQTSNIFDYLHQNYGNAFLQKIIQSELKINKSGDIYGRKIDKVADEVKHMPKIDIREETEKDKKNVKKLASDLGLNFEYVKVYINEESKHRTEANGANGLMDCGMIYLNPLAYVPNTIEGKSLLGHELAHLAQRNNRKRPGNAHRFLLQSAEAEAAAIGSAFAHQQIVWPPICTLPSNAIVADTGTQLGKRLIIRDKFNDEKVEYDITTYSLLVQVVEFVIDVILEKLVIGRENKEYEQLWNNWIVFFNYCKQMPPNEKISQTDKNRFVDLLELKKKVITQIEIKQKTKKEINVAGQLFDKIFDCDWRKIIQVKLGDFEVKEIKTEDLFWIPGYACLLVNENPSRRDVYAIDIKNKHHPAAFALWNEERYNEELRKIRAPMYYAGYAEAYIALIITGRLPAIISAGISLCDQCLEYGTNWEKYNWGAVGFDFIFGMITYALAVLLWKRWPYRLFSKEIVRLQTWKNLAYSQAIFFLYGCLINCFRESIAHREFWDLVKSGMVESLFHIAKEGGIHTILGKDFAKTIFPKGRGDYKMVFISKLLDLIYKTAIRQFMDVTPQQEPNPE